MRRMGTRGGATARMLAVGALTLAVGAGTALDAAAAPTPQLSISLSDGLDTVHSGMSVSYAATVENSGAAAVTGTLALDVPSYGHYTKTAGGKAKKQRVSWKVQVPAGKTVRKKVTVRLAKIGAGQLRVTTLASFYLGSTSASPIVRTADADHIQGVVDPTPSTPPASSPSSSTAAPAQKAAAGDSDSGLGALAWTLIGVGALIVLAGGLLFWRGRGRGAPQHRGADPVPADQETVDVPGPSD